MNLTRREAVGSLFAASGALALPGCFSLGREDLSAYGETLIDRCWMWGDDANMAEACAKMGIDNLSVVRRGDVSAECRRKIGGMKRVAWTIGGCPDGSNAASGILGGRDLSLLDEMPNLIGFEMDDFFRPSGPAVTVDTPFGPRQSLSTAFPYDRLLALRRRMDAFERPPDLRVAVDDGLLDREELLMPCADLATAATFWTRKGADVANLERNFRKYRDLLPAKPTFLGVCLWDFDEQRPMRLDDLRFELEFGLDLWRRREIEGFVFRATSICNYGLPTVEYVRQWLVLHAHDMRHLEPEPYSVGRIASRLTSVEDNRRFLKAFEFLRRPDLGRMPVGHYEIDGENVFALIKECDLKPVAEAAGEVHRRYIDIHAPLSGEETYGVARLTDGNFRRIFDSKSDVAHFDQDWRTFTVHPGEFAMFLPPRGLHAPGLTTGAPHRIRKLVVKVKYRT